MRETPQSARAGGKSGRGGAAGESTGAGISVVALSEALTTSRLM
jgi:hypothetical protein